MGVQIPPRKFPVRVYYIDRKNVGVKFIMPIEPSKYPRGSEWRKWDLHVHPVLSSGSYKVFIENLKKSEAEIIGINDYCTIEGYKNISESGGVSNKTIFPVIEFRMNNIVLNKNDNRSKSGVKINFHVIFNNNLEHIPRINTWLNSIKCFCEGGKEDSLGNISTPEERSKISVDYFEVIKNLEFDLNLKDSFLIWLPYDEYGGIDEIDPETEGYFKSGLINKANLIGSSNRKQIDFFLWKNHKHSEENIKKWLNDKKIPCIKGSDAHEIDYPFGKLKNDKSEPINKYCWIKADPTFEGLKQIIYEPDLRVKIQSDKPSDLETYARIDDCTINLPAGLKIDEVKSGRESDFCLQGDYKINFSNNLTCLIGGRGSGKSSLVHILYSAQVGCDEKIFLDPTCSNYINSPLINLKLGKEVLQTLRKLTKTSIPPKTEFFFQNEIEKSAKDVDKMSELVLHRLMNLSKLDIGKSDLAVLKMEWVSTSNRMAELIESFDEIYELNKKISEIQSSIETLRKQTAVITSEDYKKFQESIEMITKEIAVFESYKKEYNNVIKYVDELLKIIHKTSWDYLSGKDIIQEMRQKLEEYKKRLSEVYLGKDDRYKKNNHEQALLTIKNKFKEFLQLKGLSQENIGELADANEKIIKMDAEINDLNVQRESQDIIYKQRDNVLNDYKEKYQNYKTRYSEVCANLETRLKDLQFETRQIEFEVGSNERIINDPIINFVKTNCSGLRQDDIATVLFGGVDINSYVSDKEAIKKHINEYGGAATKHQKELMALVNDNNLLEKLYLRLIQSCFSTDNIQVQTMLGDKTLQNTSFGERCGIVIVIILVAGTNPIIIDQPEDNLDGKFISNVLVPLIKRQKQNRQVILITRDANIVIGADAELMHILDNTGGKTSIIPSTIENLDYREKYIWILDGGKEAFRKRENKYNIKTI